MKNHSVKTGILISCSAILASTLAQATALKPTNFRFPRNQVMQYDFDGLTFTINASEIAFNVMNHLDCANFTEKEQIVEPAGFFKDSQTIDPTTGNFAIAVDLGYCAASQQTGILLVDTQPNGQGFYRLQVPGDKSLPNEFSTYAIEGLKKLEYLSDGSLQVIDSTACGASTFRQFSPVYEDAILYYPKLEWTDRKGCLEH